MTVPNDHTICRFVRDKDWSLVLGGPKAGAFKGPTDRTTGNKEISNWDRTDMMRHGHRIITLRTGNLVEHRNVAYLKAADYRATAAETRGITGEPCRINILYTPDSASPEHQPWAYAHVDVVEIDTGSTAQEFRENLRNRAREIHLCECCDTTYHRGSHHVCGA